MTHKVEILFHRKVADLLLFNYLDISSHNKPHAQIYSQNQSLSQGCNLRKQRKIWCFEEMTDKVPSIFSFSLLCPPCYHVDVQLQLSHTIRMVLVADDKKRTHLKSYLDFCPVLDLTNMLVLCLRKRYCKCLISIFTRLLLTSEVIHNLAESFS